MSEQIDGTEEAPIRGAVNDPAYWRDCARRMRRDASAARDPAVKATMREIAAMYQELARWTKQHTAPGGWIEQLRYGRNLKGDGSPPARRVEAATARRR